MTIRSPLIALFCLTFVNQSIAGGSSDRYVKQHLLPTGQVVVVAEGDLEPRSIGSYTVRVYSNDRPEYPTDDFVCGLVQSRDGSVENVIFADVDRDSIKEIIVTIRSVGTGSYLSADAFAFKDKRLARIGAVSGLPKDADCVSALVNAIKKTPNKAPQGTARKLADPQR